MGMFILWGGGVGEFGTEIWYVNIVGVRWAWGRDYRC